MKTQESGNLRKGGTVLAEKLIDNDFVMFDLEADSAEEVIRKMADKSSRPEIAEKVSNMADYDVIFVGLPIWWYVAPTIINTFLEQYALSGKKIVLFATSGGSGFGKTVENLKGSVAADTIIKEGKLLNGSISEAELRAWAKEIAE